MRLRHMIFSCLPSNFQTLVHNHIGSWQAAELTITRIFTFRSATSVKICCSSLERQRNTWPGRSYRIWRHGGRRRRYIRRSVEAADITNSFWHSSFSCSIHRLEAKLWWTSIRPTGRCERSTKCHECVYVFRVYRNLLTYHRWNKTVESWLRAC